MIKTSLNKYFVSISYLALSLLIYYLGLEYEMPYLKAIAFGVMFFNAINLDKVIFFLFLFSLSLTNYYYPLGNADVALEIYRVIFFASILALSNKRICAVLCLSTLWLSFTFCPKLVANFESIQCITLEILTLALMSVVFKKDKNSLFQYQSNLIITCMSVLLLVTLISITSNISLAAIRAILITLMSSALISFLFSNNFKNIFNHIELATTPDASFMLLSVKPIIKLKEYKELEDMLVEKAQLITGLRRISIQQKNSLDNYAIENQEIRDKLEDLELISNSVDDGFIILNDEGIVRHANNRFYEIFRITRSDISLSHYKLFLNSFTKNLELIIQDALVNQNYQNYVLNNQMQISSIPLNDSLLISIKTKNLEHSPTINL